MTLDIKKSPELKNKRCKKRSNYQKKILRGKYSPQVFLKKAQEKVLRWIIRHRTIKMTTMYGHREVQKVTLKNSRDKERKSWVKKNDP